MWEPRQAWLASGGKARGSEPLGAADKGGHRQLWIGSGKGPPGSDCSIRILMGQGPVDGQCCGAPSHFSLPYWRWGVGSVPFLLLWGSLFAAHPLP